MRQTFKDGSQPGLNWGGWLVVLLPHCAANEERSHLLHVAGGLLRFSHRLNTNGRRREFLPNQPDDEVIIVFVYPEAGETYVLGIARRTERMADSAMFAKDRGLLLLRQGIELTF